MAGPEATGLQALLDADAVALSVPVRLEILSMAGQRNYVRLRRLLSALPVFVPAESTRERGDTCVGAPGQGGASGGGGAARPSP